MNLTSVLPSWERSHIPYQRSHIWVDELPVKSPLVNIPYMNAMGYVFSIPSLKLTASSHLKSMDGILKSWKNDSVVFFFGMEAPATGTGAKRRSEPFVLGYVSYIARRNHHSPTTKKMAPWDCPNPIVSNHLQCFRGSIVSWIRFDCFREDEGLIFHFGGDPKTQL